MNQIDAIAEVLSENVGFTRGAVNPDTQGWRDIVEWLFEMPEVRVALVERYGDRITEYAERVEEAYERDAERERVAAMESRLDQHYFELAKAITRQYARKLNEGRS